MSVINKTMKTFNVPDGNNTKCYEIVDDKGRKCIAKDWASNSSSAFAVGEHVIKDGVCYKFTSAHTAGSAWSASEVVETNLGDEITDLKSAIGTVPTGKTVQGQIDALENGLEKGTYEDLTAGNALYLLSERGDTDVAPYVFRKTGGAKNGYGREFLRKIVGGTVAWNQKVAYARGSTTVYSLTLTRSEDAHSLTISGTPNATGGITIIQGSINIEANHVYLADIITKSVTGAVIRFANLDGSIGSSAMIVKKASSSLAGLELVVTNGTAVSITVTPQVFDLTAMFGSTIADAIYAMEQATAGSGVAWFRSLFPNSYYAYDAGSLQSVQAASHVLTGFNLWDEQWEVGGINTADGTDDNTMTTRIRSKNYIPVRPNTMYYKGSPNNVRHVYYDINKNFISAGGWGIEQFLTPSNCHYLRFMVDPAYGTTYKNDICINISDVSRNGQYEPYAEHTYPIDSTLTLRGIPKWDSTNGLYYDGDEYTPDGSVKRKYGIVDLGTLTWIEVNGIMKASLQNVKAYIAVVCSKYLSVAIASVLGKTIDKSCAADDIGRICVYDSAYSDAATFKTAMSGVYLVYELATPTTEQAEPFRELQISAHGGTEEFVDAGVTASTPTRDVSVPVGTETFYPVDIWHLIDELTALVLEN